MTKLSTLVRSKLKKPPSSWQFMWLWAFLWGAKVVTLQILLSWHRLLHFSRGRLLNWWNTTLAVLLGVKHYSSCLFDILYWRWTLLLHLNSSLNGMFLKWLSSSLAVLREGLVLQRTKSIKVPSTHSLLYHKFSMWDRSWAFLQQLNKYSLNL